MTSDTSFLLTGLGNPGREYRDSRHNVGFMLVDRIAVRLNARAMKVQSKAIVMTTMYEDRKLILAKPQTYMNLSGGSVRPLLERYGEGDAANLIVASDEAALPFGMIRVRGRGSAGGQKGLKSIIERIGSQEFPRVRLGVKPDHPVSDLSSFVLSPIPKRDREALDRMLDRAADAVEAILIEGVERAMSLFNERVKQSSEA